MEKLIELPENATNGDAFMATFPGGDLHDYDYYDGYVIYELNYKDLRFDAAWWYAPYVTEKPKMSKVQTIAFILFLLGGLVMFLMSPRW